MYESMYPTKHGTVSKPSFAHPDAPVHILTGNGGPPDIDRFLGKDAPFSHTRSEKFGYGRVVVPNATHFIYEQVLNGYDGDEAGDVLETIVVEQHSHGAFERPTPLKSDDDDGAAAIDIGNSTQLFVDDLLIATRSEHLTRSLHRPDCSRVAVTTDAPWEHNFTMGLIGTNIILRDDGTLQLWYSLRNSTLGCRPANVPAGQNDMPPCSAHDPPQPNYESTAGKIYIGYAESSDGGRSWEKPMINKYLLRSIFM